MAGTNFEVEVALKQQGDKIAAMQKDLEKLGVSATKTQSKLNKFSGTVKSITGAIAGYIAVSKGLEIGGNLAKGVIDTTASFEKYLSILKTLEGSQAKAEKSFEWVKDFAKTTPYELEQVTEAFVKMKSYGLDPSGLKTYGDTAAAMGKDLMQITEAYGDAITGENERLKEFGVKASKMGEKIGYEWVDAAGKTKSIIIENNKAIIESTLTTIFNSKYEGAMNELSNTWLGLTSNLSDNWTQFQQKVGQESGVFDRLKNSVKALIGEFENIAPDTEAIKVFGGVAQNVISGIMSGFQAIISIGAFLKNTFSIISGAMENLYLLGEVGVNKFITTVLSARRSMLEVAKSLQTGDKAEETQHKIDNLTKSIARLNGENHLSLIQIGKNAEGAKKAIQETNKATDTINDAISKVQKAFNKPIDIKVTTNAGEAGKKAEVAGAKTQGLKDQVKALKKATDAAKGGDFIEYLKAIGREADASYIELANKIKEFQKAGQLTDTQIGEFAEAEYKKIADAEVKSLSEKNQQKLALDLEYYKATKNYAKAEELELALYKEELKTKGFSDTQQLDLQVIKTKELKAEMADLRAQELESQTTMSAGFEKYFTDLESRMTNYSAMTESVMQGIEGSLTSSLGSFFDYTSESFLNLKDLMGNLTQSILGMIQQMITKMIAMKIMQAAMGGATGGAGGGIGSMFAGMFATGGYTGPGTKYTPKGVVHAGEYVFNKEQTAKIGLSNLESMANGNMPVAAAPVSSGPSVVINNNSSARIQQTTDENGTVTVEMLDEIDKKLAARTRQGRSTLDKMNNKKYHMKKQR